MAVDTCRASGYHAAMDEALSVLGRAWPLELVQEMAALARARFVGGTMLHWHEGRVVRTEKRTQRKYT